MRVMSQIKMVVVENPVLLTVINKLIWVVDNSVDIVLGDISSADSDHRVQIVIPNPLIQLT